MPFDSSTERKKKDKDIISLLMNSIVEFIKKIQYLKKEIQHIREPLDDGKLGDNSLFLLYRRYSNKGLISDEKIHSIENKLQQELSNNLTKAEKDKLFNEASLAIIKELINNGTNADLDHAKTLLSELKNENINSFQAALGELTAANVSPEQIVLLQNVKNEFDRIINAVTAREDGYLTDKVSGAVTISPKLLTECTSIQQQLAKLKEVSRIPYKCICKTSSPTNSDLGNEQAVYVIYGNELYFLRKGASGPKKVPILPGRDLSRFFTEVNNRIGINAYADLLPHEVEAILYHTSHDVDEGTKVLRDIIFTQKRILAADKDRGAEVTKEKDILKKVRKEKHTDIKKKLKEAASKLVMERDLLIKEKATIDAIVGLTPQEKEKLIEPLRRKYDAISTQIKELHKLCHILLQGPEIGAIGLLFTGDAYFSIPTFATPPAVIDPITDLGGNNLNVSDEAKLDNVASVLTRIGLGLAHRKQRMTTAAT